jgi:deoxyadenosine/deoxycytidine kinase
MYVVIEGFSHSGKSTLIKNLQKYDKRYIIFSGHGQINVPGAENWKLYNHFMHMIISRIADLNPDHVILHDRGFTEAVYKKDDELLARYTCYDDVLVIILDADKDTLKERLSHDNINTDVVNLYKPIIDRFKCYVIRTQGKTPEQVAKFVHNVIMKEVDQSVHNSN